MKIERDLVILGGGLTGLAAASLLGARATVLERDARPGGLVRTERLGQHWFDRVIHHLYFHDAETEARVKALMGEALQPCHPVAWVETAAGTCRYPIQMNLAGLDPEVRVQCLTEIARIAYGPPGPDAVTIEDNFLAAFGPTLCDLFLLPYNRKMWKRPLGSIAHRGLSWTVDRPDFAAVLRGALQLERPGIGYNARGYYPRPAPDAPVRGMEAVSAALARRAHDVRLRCEVSEIDAAARIVRYRQARAEGGFTDGEVSWRDGVLSSLPLPRLAAMCPQVPSSLRARMARLRHNRVMSVFVALTGPRPTGTGHWRYYADPSIRFSRLIFMHEFDPGLAPEDGWGVLAEVTQPAEDPLPDEKALCREVIADARRVGAIRPADEVVASRAIVADPAYVVLAEGDHEAVAEAIDLFARLGVTCRGRYGMWKYSSMSQSIAEGFGWAESMGAGATRAEER